MLSHWACIYCWIIGGGFQNLKEDLTPFEDFIKNVIAEDLDAVSFFDESILEYEDDLLNKWIEQWIEQFKNMDHIWKTRENWKAFVFVGFYGNNEDGYVVLTNNTTKEYMIVYSSILENEFNDEKFKYVSENELINLVKQLKNEQFTILSHSEESFFDEMLE